ncbi:MAG: polysaccharide deacetylase family protein [Campylobacterales bacterium]|nr:polysaccharide deacetylase family protein [Campylobacterales bacterium]
MRILLYLLFSFFYLWADAHIFVYHRFDDPRHKTANTTTEQLIEQFEYFKNNGYEVVKIEQILQKLEQNETIPSHWVALTIDDAYKSFYENGYKIFKEYNYPFSLFVYVEATNKKYGDFMTWDMIKEVSDIGTVGLHSYSHPRLQNLTTQEVIEDTQKAFDTFKAKLGYEPKIYAYPYGEYTDQVTKTLKQNFPFQAILNQNIGSVNLQSDIFDINRIALVGEVDIEHKLRYNSFDVKWHEPKYFPEDGILRKVKASVDPKYTTLNLYITGFGWRDVEVKDGIVDLDLNIYLKNSRTRVMLSSDFFTISNKILNKTTKKGK